MGKTSSGVEIRAASPEDVAAVYEISRVSLPAETWRKETILSDMQRDGTAWFVAKWDGTTVGFASFWFVLDEAELVNTAVLPEVRRMGIASRLLEAGLAEAEKRGMKSMFLEVRTGNAAARNLYEGYGFQYVATRKNEYEHPREDGYIMRRAIAPDTHGS